MVLELGFQVIRGGKRGGGEAREKNKISLGSRASARGDPRYRESQAESGMSGTRD